MSTTMRWAIEWYSKNALDGVTRHFMWDGERPRLYLTRAAARAEIKAEYGYILTRPDLRAEPHGWRLPRAVRVRVKLERAK